MATRAGLAYETIVQQAATLADQSGFAALSMASLAAHLGVSSPALYHYFAGLAGLRRAIALRGLQLWAEAMGRAVQGKAGDEAVLALAQALRDFARARPGLYEAASRAPEQEDHEWMAAGREVVEIMLRTLAAYHLPPDAARHAIRMLRSAVHGCVSLERLGGFGLPGAADETFRGLLVALLDYVHGHLEAKGA
ncbi:MAG TPA: TetR-like C-terminal domain-containing protein [Ktedonobacterales bacterium]|nr:TetR-like C-terminal domain-containing protein [Ktedonobacterales bacterium]